MSKTVILSFLIYFVIALSTGARILGIIPTPSYSHQVVFQPLWRELSLRGHQLTVLTTNPINDPALTNLTEIDLGFSYETWNNNLLDIINSQQESSTKSIDIMATTLFNITDQQLQYSEVQKLIKNETEHFDLLMIEYLMPTMFAFAERFKCPIIGMVSVDALSDSYQAVGNPTHPVLYPDFMLPFGEQLNFFERLGSTLFMLFGYYYEYYYGYQQKELIRRHFGDNYPHTRDITRTISMLFVNTDPVFHRIRPLTPAVVQIGGGSHRQVPKPLPEDLQKLLDRASSGFIYFSLGSNVKSKDLSEETRSILLQTFAELPYLVLWKFELEDLPRKPKNVVISKWFPQQDIFKHPNIKLFITQGGLQSIDEAIYDYIPMIGMPFFADQPANVKKMVSKGMGLIVDHLTLNKDSFKKTILEVINNPKYRNRVKELADLAKDQPMTGLERAVWWTEYVLRHKGAKHLRSPVLDLPSYQYYLLDVIGFCLLVVITVTYLLIKLTRLAFKIVKYILVTTKPKVE